MTDVDHSILAQVRDWFGDALPERLGVAVSGGGDSVALLHILTRCFGANGPEIHAVTVDHGLRAGSADEATMVARLAGDLSVPHDTLRWEGWDGTGNLQDQARRARYRLLSRWARSRGVEMLALAHTADDQAETVLMRLGRAAGVDGLSGIPERRIERGVTFVRPLLGVTRQALRAYLTRNAVEWVEDPSNQDDRFDRIRARRALQALQPLGITVTALADVARHMAQARAALDWYAFLAARDVARLDAGDVLIDRRGFRILPEEIARRMLARVVRWVAGGEYPPRRAPLAGAIDAIRHGRRVTLAGCVVGGDAARARVCREYAAVRDTRCAAGGIWDGRWRLIGPDPQGCEVRALGRDGLASCPAWRETGRPAECLIATPSVWRGDELIAAPVAGRAGQWRAETMQGDEEFFASFLSH